MPRFSAALVEASPIRRATGELPARVDRGEPPPGPRARRSAGRRRAARSSARAGGGGARAGPGASFAAAGRSRGRWRRAPAPPRAVAPTRSSELRTTSVPPSVRTSRLSAAISSSPAKATIRLDPEHVEGRVEALGGAERVVDGRAHPRVGRRQREHAGWRLGRSMRGQQDRTGGGPAAAESRSLAAVGPTRPAG